jgi:hypothetical protein
VVGFEQLGELIAVDTQPVPFPIFAGDHQFEVAGQCMDASLNQGLENVFAKMSGWRVRHLVIGLGRVGEPNVEEILEHQFGQNIVDGVVNADLEMAEKKQEMITLRKLFTLYLSARTRMGNVFSAWRTTWLQYKKRRKAEKTFWHCGSSTSSTSYIQLSFSFSLARAPSSRRSISGSTFDRIPRCFSPESLDEQANSSISPYVDEEETHVSSPTRRTTSARCELLKYLAKSLSDSRSSAKQSMPEYHEGWMMTNTEWRIPGQTIRDMK